MSVTEHEDGNLKCVSDCTKHWLNKLKNPPSASLTTTTLVDKTVWQHELNCGGSPRCCLIGPSTALIINSICLWFVVLSQFFIHSINVHFRRLSGGGCCVILPIFHQFIKKKIQFVDFRFLLQFSTWYEVGSHAGRTHVHSTPDH